MDADCLIKITKAGLKGLVVSRFKVFIPFVVEREVVKEGKKRRCDDAPIIGQNIAKKTVTVLKAYRKAKSGDEALFLLYRKDKFDAVATDDAKLIRRFKAAEIPFIVPGLLLYRLFSEGRISRGEAGVSLDRLSEFISEDETTTVRLLMEKIK